jgi:hypothetical protein
MWVECKYAKHLKHDYEPSHGSLRLTSLRANESLKLKLKIDHDHREWNDDGNRKAS